MFVIASMNVNQLQLPLFGSLYILLVSGYPSAFRHFGHMRSLDPADICLDFTGHKFANKRLRYVVMDLRSSVHLFKDLVLNHFKDMEPI